jgi:hypothetical protein
MNGWGGQTEVVHTASARWCRVQDRDGRLRCSDKIDSLAAVGPLDVYSITVLSFTLEASVATGDGPSALDVALLKVPKTTHC